MIVQITDIGPNSSYYHSRDKIIGLCFETLNHKFFESDDYGFSSAFFTDVCFPVEKDTQGFINVLKTQGQTAICSFKYKILFK